MIKKPDKNLNDIGFQMAEPCPELKPFIQCYWFIKTEERLRTAVLNKIISDGGSGLVFNFGTPFIIFAGDDSCIVRGRHVFTGVTDQTVLLKLKHRINAVGVRFYPGVSSLVAGEYINGICEICDSSFEGISGAYSSLSDARDASAQKDILDGFMLKVFARHIGREPEWIQCVVQYMKTECGSATIEEIASEFALSRRQFGRKFLQAVGLTPKQYLKIARIEKARSMLRDGEKVSLTTVGYECDYYDQAHFIKEFKGVVNLTPSQYFSSKKMSRLYNSED